MSNFDLKLDELERHGLKLPNNLDSLKLADAENILRNALAYYLSFQNRNLLWLEEYSKVADWLSDNKGRGLFLYGNCGRGKSLLGRYVIPAIYLKYFRKVVSTYDVQEMNKNLDEVLKKAFISLDDIGTEEAVNTYGNKRMAFAEIMDAVEKESKIVIISSNLSEKELLDTYGDRVLDRIKSTTTRIAFNGKSLRR